MRMQENLSRAFYESDNSLERFNEKPKPHGKFKELTRETFYKWIVPFANKYRKLDIYDKYPVVIKVNIPIFGNFVTIGLGIEGKDEYDLEEISISKKKQDREIEEYARDYVKNSKKE